MTTVPTSHTLPARPSACPLHRLFDIPHDPASPSRRLTPSGFAIFAYGLLAYAAFFATFLYTIGFVGNWFVPRSIDIGPESPLPQAILINTSILVLFVAQHTIMARRWFKAWWTRVIPAAAERSTFVLAASAVLALLLWQWRPLPQVLWRLDHPAAYWTLTALSLLGWAIVLLSSAMINHFDLFGLRQAAFGLLNREYRPVGFRLVGLYRFVRHPLMVGFLIAFWATPTMTLGHLLFALLTTGYIFFGTWIEERDLLAEHPKSYLHYRRQVPAFIPSPRRHA